MEAYRSFLVNDCSPLRRKIVADINVLIGDIASQSTDAGLAAEQSATAALRLIAVLAALAVVIAVAVAFAITRGLLRQLGGEPAYAMAIAQRIAHGDLAVEVATRSGDRSSLLHALRMMRDSLAGIVGQVRQGPMRSNAPPPRFRQRRPVGPHRTPGQLTGRDRQRHGGDHLGRAPERGQCGAGQ
jgi:methyl-accepting chemotaxis protein